MAKGDPSRRKAKDRGEARTCLKCRIFKQPTAYRGLNRTCRACYLNHEELMRFGGAWD